MELELEACDFDREAFKFPPTDFPRLGRGVQERMKALSGIGARGSGLGQWFEIAWTAFIFGTMLWASIEYRVFESLA